MIVQRYIAGRKAEWDAFVEASRNATFLLRRDYMDYHADRFADASLMLYEGERLMALLPASAHGTEIRSHGGLTYGGLVMPYSGSFSAMTAIEAIETIKAHYAAQGFERLIYKPIPHIYHRYPAEEDIYALWRAGAQLESVNLATAIQLRNAIKSSRLGKRAAKRARRFNIEISETNHVGDFWDIIVDDRRVRHNTTPVHSLEEMERLHSLLPDNIKLYVATVNGRIVAGAVVYDTGQVLHLQYAAATAEGKEIYAVDAIYHHLIFNLRPDALYFDFGTSNEDGGRFLNTGMVLHKEEFGGRSIAYPTFSLKL